MATFEELLRFAEERGRLDEETQTMRNLNQRINEAAPNAFQAELQIVDINNNLAYKCSVPMTQAKSYLANNYNAKMARLSDMDALLANMIVE